MGRRQATEYLKSHSIDEPPWSLLEIRWVTNNPELYEKYKDELHRVHGVRAIISGPGMEKGQIYGFDGETPQEAERQLNHKLECLDRRFAADTALAEAMEKSDRVNKLGAAAAKAFFHEKLTEALRNHSDLYDPEKLPNYARVKQAFYDAGGEDSDLTVRYWRRSI
jgi:hypothetical protein